MDSAEKNQYHLIPEPRQDMREQGREGESVKKRACIVTAGIMLAVSVLVVYLVDAVVQIDDDAGLLILLLLIVNALILTAARRWVRGGKP